MKFQKPEKVFGKDIDKLVEFLTKIFTQDNMKRKVYQEK